MLPAFVRVQGIYETVRNFITASWTSGYWRGDCGFENFSKDRLTKGFRNFLSLLQTRCLIILWHKQQSLSSIDVSIQFTSWLHRASIIFNTLITNIGTKCNSLTQQFIGIYTTIDTWATCFDFIESSSGPQRLQIQFLKIGSVFFEKMTR